MKPRGVLLLHNLPAGQPAGGGQLPWRESVAGVLDEVKAVAEALDQKGIPYRVRGVARLAELQPILAESLEPVVFNLVENFAAGDAAAARVPALCQAAGKGVTGCDTPCQVLALDKWQTTRLLASAGLPVPAGALVPVGREAAADALPPGPWIVKPVQADGSEGILPSSVVAAPGEALAAAVRRVHEQFRQPALVETLIGQREVNAALIQRGAQVEVLPLSEIDFSRLPADRPRIVDYSAKWLLDSVECRSITRIIPAPLPPELAERVRALARAAWAVMDCRDYARVDFRLDERGRPFILEVNPNPDICPLAGLPAALKVAGIPFADFVVALIENARARRPPAAAG